MNKLWLTEIELGKLLGLLLKLAENVPKKTLRELGCFDYLQWLEANAYTIDFTERCLNDQTKD